MWKKLNKQIQKWQAVLIIAPTVAGVVIAGSMAGVFNLLEWSVRDRYFRLRPQEAVDDRIVIVTIDEPDINYVKQWPMSDRVLAQILQNIKAQQPRAIAIDVYRDLPTEPGNKELNEVFKTTPNLFGIEKLSGNPIPPPPTLEKQGQVMSNDLLLDGDGKVRRGLVMVSKKDRTIRQGFGVNMALQYLEKEKIELQVIDSKKKIYGLGKAVFVPLTGKEGEYNKAETGGYQILLNYRGGLNSFPNISMTDVLENRIPPDFMRDRLVFLGSIAPSLNDNFQTPLSNSLFTVRELTPGIVIHANLASQVLSAALEGRPMLQASAKSLNWVLIVFWSFWSAAFGSLYVRRRWISGVGIFVAVSIIVIVSYVAFLWGWSVPVFTPVVAVFGAAIFSIGTTLWNNLNLSYQKVREYAQTLEIKNEELRLAEENYRSIFENALEGIFQRRTDGRYTSINPAMARIYGYDSAAEMIAAIANISRDLYVDQSSLDEFFRQVETEGKVKNFEYRAYRKDGSIIWVQEDTRVVRSNNGDLLYYEGIIQDITERKRQEEELKRQLKELRIEIDQQKRQQEVATITQSDYFQEIQAEADQVSVDDFWN